MSNYEVCRDCEHFSVEDTVLCRDCAENGFIDLMNADAQRRWETFIGELMYTNAAELDRYSDQVFQAWFNKDPKKAGEIVFAMFDAELDKFQQDGEL
jgi:hypothetical protein